MTGTSLMKMDQVASVIDAEPSLRRTVAAGLAVIGLFFAGVIGWTFFAHLNSAVVGQGSVVVDSHRKTVQHLEGGILRELLVEEGSHVHAGQVLAYLDATQADAALGQLMSQFWATKVRLARLRAEQDGVRTITLPPDAMAESTSPVVADIIASQQRLFDARWRAYDSQVGVLQKHIDQFNETIESDRMQLTSIDRQIALTDKELSGVKTLYDRGYERLPRLLQLERSVADLQGKGSELRGDIGKSKQAIAGSELEIKSAADSRLSDIGKEMQDALAVEADVADKLRAAKDVQQRRAILAPQDGVVVDLKVFTSGGVIAPGQPLMDIVPADDSLVVEAKVQPQDIETLHVGMPAQVLLTSYKRTEVPPVDGKVINISADQLTDARSGETYFVVRVAVSPTELARLKRVKLQPGMPAEVMLVSGERRAINYLLDPLTDRMRRAFNER